MSKKQLARLSIVLMLPLIILGAFLANTSTVTRKIVISCTVLDDNPWCFDVSGQDSFYYDENAIHYVPFVPFKRINVRITPTNAFYLKKYNYYKLEDYRDSEQLLLAYNNGIKGELKNIFTFVNAVDRPVANDCSFTRYNNSELFVTGGYNRTCLDSVYFAFSDPIDQELMRDIDRESIRIYEKIELKNTILKYFLFLAPVLTYFILIVLIIVFRKVIKYVVHGKF